MHFLVRLTLQFYGIIGLLHAVLLFPISLSGQTVLKPADNLSSVRFVIRNFGFNVEGRLSGLNGEIIFDPGHLQLARFDIVVKAESIQTGNRMRDEHLRKKDYLDAVRYPEIRIRSVSVTAGSAPGSFILSGTLTIKGITRNLQIPFLATREGTGYRFKGDFRINRRDFTVGGSSISLSDELTIYLEVISR